MLTEIYIELRYDITCWDLALTVVQKTKSKGVNLFIYEVIRKVLKGSTFCMILAISKVERDGGRGREGGRERERGSDT